MRTKTNRKKTASKASEGAPPAPVPTTAKGAQTAAGGVAAPTTAPAPSPSQSISAGAQATTAPREPTDTSGLVLVRAMFATLAPAARARLVTLLFATLAALRAAVVIIQALPWDDRTTTNPKVAEAFKVVREVSEPIVTDDTWDVASAAFTVWFCGSLVDVGSAGSFTTIGVGDVDRAVWQLQVLAAEAPGGDATAPDRKALARARLPGLLAEIAEHLSWTDAHSNANHPRDQAAQQLISTMGSWAGAWQLYYLGESLLKLATSYDRNDLFSPAKYFPEVKESDEVLSMWNAELVMRDAALGRECIEVAVALGTPLASTGNGPHVCLDAKLRPELADALRGDMRGA